MANSDGNSNHPALIRYLQPQPAIMAPSTLQIKTRALERLIKEEKLYREEYKEQEDYVNQLKANPETDEFDLKKQIEILNESEKMIPAIRGKVAEHLKDLKEYLSSYDGSDDTGASQKTIEAAEKLVN